MAVNPAVVRANERADLLEIIDRLRDISDDLQDVANYLNARMEFGYSDDVNNCRDAVVDVMIDLRDKLDSM